MSRKCIHCGFIDYEDRMMTCPNDGSDLSYLANEATRIPGDSAETPIELNPGGFESTNHGLTDASHPPQVRDLGPLTKFAKVMLVVTILVNLISIFSDWLQLTLLQEMDLKMLDDAAIVANDTRQRLIALLRIAVFVLTGFTVLRWIHRANKRCRALGADDMTFTPGWAVGYYFVPILWLYKPYQAMKEIWKASVNPRNWRDENGSWLLVTW